MEAATASAVTALKQCPRCGTEVASVVCTDNQEILVERMGLYYMPVADFDRRTTRYTLKPTFKEHLCVVAT